jgi:spermidine synthase
VLAEIEPGVLGAARTFADYNHRVLDDPRLHVVFNDGRNFLSTTRERFDVITADPIHPWSGGAAYLYTQEYFRTVAEHLAPGGVACQWLPIYELSVDDVRSVARTFRGQFKHVMVWLTWYDAELVGSNDPLALDLTALERRMAVPAIRRDLEVVDMGTPEAFLAYFLAGTSGVEDFAAGAITNTDDNLSLEFSAPRSMGLARAMGDNVQALARHREPIEPWLGAAGADGRLAERLHRAGTAYDGAHTRFLWSGPEATGLAASVAAVRAVDPGYAPLRFLERKREELRGMEPRLLGAVSFATRGEDGAPSPLTISAVLVGAGATRAAVMLVDNDRREVYGQRYFDGTPDELEATASSFAAQALSSLRESGTAAGTTPPRGALAQALRARVAVLVADTTGDRDGGPPGASGRP